MRLFDGRQWITATADDFLSVPEGMASGVHVFEQDAQKVEMDSSGYLNRVTLDPGGDAFMFDFKSERDFKTFLDLTGSEPVGEVDVDKQNAPAQTGA